MEIAFARAIEDDAVLVDQSELIAVAQKRDGRALGDLDADAGWAGCAGRWPARPRDSSSSALRRASSGTLQDARARDRARIFQ